MAMDDTLPRVVREEAEAAERLFAETQQAAQEPVSEPASEPAPAEAKEAEPEQGDITEAAPVGPMPTHAEPPKPEKAAEAAAEPEPAPDELAELRAKHERLQHSHDVLKGKYSKELPRLHAQVRAERESRAQLESALAEAQKARETAPIDPQNPYGLSAAELELGPEVAAVAEKIANRLTAQKVAELEKKIPQQQPEPQPDPFWEDLIIEEPDAWEINNNPKFHLWLQRGLYGVPRLQIIRTIQNEWKQPGDAKRAAAMMHDWQEEEEQQSAKQAETPSPKPVVAGKSGRPSLAAQVALNTVGASPAPAQKKTYTLAQYEHLIADIVKGRYMPQDAQKLQAELDQAFAENRIV